MMVLIKGVKLASPMGLKAVHIAADNLADIWSTICMTGAVGNPCHARPSPTLNTFVYRLCVYACEMKEWYRNH